MKAMVGAVLLQLTACSLLLGDSFDSVRPYPDAGFGQRKSANGKMTGASQQEDSGPACEPAPERCNGMDDDCDGTSDEAEAAGGDCSARLHSPAQCTHGFCLKAGLCDTGYFNCDGMPDNGCEKMCECSKDCESHEGSVLCGDGQVSGIEKCDTGIGVDQPGACPKECSALADCVPRILNGSGCQTECVLRQLTCQSGDGCCPGNCTKDNDEDCSGRCGDGIVQTTSGETCEPETDHPCLSSVSACNDDDGCTIDRLTGSAANCNVACTHERIQRPGPDDACCPEGANANTDPNCEPRCGNGVKEPGEDCDGSADCDANCRRTCAIKGRCGL